MCELRLGSERCIVDGVWMEKLPIERSVLTIVASRAGSAVFGTTYQGTSDSR
jgi:hypothetical protein